MRAKTTTRFAWRERTERLNWRLLRNLHLADVLRRGDPALLEPYALHLTFAKLPVPVLALSPSRLEEEPHDAEGESLFAARRRGGDDDRNAWFIVRVFQLSMEYLLFLRARDGTVMDTLRQEMVTCEKECELFAERARKWKDRARSNDRQVEKLHQVLQNVAKLLEIEGTTPSAVSTIETLLLDLVSHRGTSKDKRRTANQVSQDVVEDALVTEARVCGLCGKMFSSKDFLDKHFVRRHAGQKHEAALPRTRPADMASKTPQQPLVPKHIDSNRPDRGMQEMLGQVEKTLQEQQASLRALAQEEANKIQSLYEQLHVETQLTEELRKKREVMEAQLKEDRKELDEILHEKTALVEQVNDLKEQLQFLSIKRKMESNTSPPVMSMNQDASMQLEITRLEQTLTLMKNTLATSREELTSLQDLHAKALKEKQSLEAQLHEAANHVLRLENTLRSTQEHVPPMRKDVGMQTIPRETASITIQTDADMMPSSAPARSVELVDEGVQTMPEERPKAATSEVQTDPIVVDIGTRVVDEKLFETDKNPAAEAKIENSALLFEARQELSDAEFNTHAESILENVRRRADRAAMVTVPASDDGDKTFSSLPRRKFLRSRHLHDEESVKQRIESCMQRVEQAAQRFGVPPQSTLLSSKHMQIVQQALHAHLEILPTEVLETMIKVENTVHSLIETEWVPNERSRKEALQRLTANLQIKSQQNQGLVRQAMAAFAALSSPQSSETKKEVSSNAQGAQSDETSAGVTVPVASSASRADSEANEVTSVSEPAGSEGQPSRLDNSVIAESTDAVSLLQHPTEPRLLSIEEAVSIKNQRSDETGDEKEILRNTETKSMTVRAVRVASASPKSSRPKLTSTMSDTISPPLPDRDTKYHDADATSAVREDSARSALTVETEGSIVFPAITSLADSFNTHDVKHGGPTSLPSRYSSLTVDVPSPSSGHNGPGSALTPQFSVNSQHSDLTPARVVEEDDQDEEHEVEIQDSRNEVHEEEDDEIPSLSIEDPRQSHPRSASSGPSMSLVASSDLSYEASIPSLNSTSASESSFPRRSLTRQSVEDLPSLESDDVDLNDTSNSFVIDRAGIIPIAEEEKKQSSDEDDGEPNAPDSSVSHQPASNDTNDVVAFDDSDIEEVMLA
ncbi:hypothetical protein Poli38472_003933 [Pythium oligandrum]|uniref:C2H2-type domain-containing protein n=1 Tax=Pythium oligandrum TaxID=41045 RepID=A0A8K1CNJ5_PYTOL|nr:hypothetical protein Poli38472_003933 [Pythium oligandrum]|eukprot:TMW66168.1 hypothetical protein Poli38472_003933 [Pythium oligandrum]